MSHLEYLKYLPQVDAICSDMASMFVIDFVSSTNFEVVMQTSDPTDYWGTFMGVPPIGPAPQGNSQTQEMIDDTTASWFFYVMSGYLGVGESVVGGGHRASAGRTRESVANVWDTGNIATSMGLWNQDVLAMAIQYGTWTGAEVVASRFGWSGRHNRFSWSDT